MEFDAWKIIGTLLVLISAGIVYWRQLKDKADDEQAKKSTELGKEIAIVRSETKDLSVANQKELMEKIGEVLQGQNSMALRVEKALMNVEEHGKDIGYINQKLSKVSDIVHNLDKKEAVNEEWKKRVEDKLKLS